MEIVNVGIVDLGAHDLAAEVERLVGLGAVRGQPYDMGFVRWHTMVDPAGNEFCVSVLQPRPVAVAPKP